MNILVMNVEISVADHDVPMPLFRCCTGRYRELQLLLLSGGSDVPHWGCLSFAVTSALHQEERIGRTNHCRDWNAWDPEQTCSCVELILTEIIFFFNLHGRFTDTWLRGHLMTRHHVLHRYINFVLFPCIVSQIIRSF